MKASRRTILKIVGGGTLVINFLPRIAFAGRNIIKSVRTGLQPGHQTRLVIETENKPSYSLSYPSGKLIVSLSNTSVNDYMQPQLASGTLINSVSQQQVGNTAQVTAIVNAGISKISDSNILLLEPNGDNKYRLVLDLSDGSENNSVQNTMYGGSTVTPAKTSNARRNVIIIDAGHGGKDPGCIGKHGTREKDIVLSVAKKLEQKLNSAGYKTYLTRNRDVFLNLGTRADIAEKRHADLFISLHANANNSRSVKGFSI